MEEDFPKYLYAFFDRNGDEVGDRVFCADDDRAVQLEELFPKFVKKNADHWRRFILTPDVTKPIKRA